jgi:hypothetical protein
VQDADQLDAVFDRYVEQNVVADRELSETDAVLLDGFTHEGVLRDQLQVLLHKIDQSIGRGDAVLGDVKSDLQKIVARRKCADDARQDHSG